MTGDRNIPNAKFTKRPDKCIEVEIKVPYSIDPIRVVDRLRLPKLSDRFFRTHVGRGRVYSRDNCTPCN